jgi:hypothetical protein
VKKGGNSERRQGFCINIFIRLPEAPTTKRWHQKGLAGAFDDMVTYIDGFNGDLWKSSNTPE